MKNPQVKFLKSLAGLCIPNYPDANLPTIFIYKNGELKNQLIGSTVFHLGLKSDGTLNKIISNNLFNK